MNPPHASQALPSPATLERRPDLRELLEEGFRLVLLLRGGQEPPSASDFFRNLETWLAAFERNALAQGSRDGAVRLATYAFCALLDETVLSRCSSLRDEWQRSPLQLRLFGEHLAGEGFFQRLEGLRSETPCDVEVLEVYHACLQLGFQGKYLLEGPERLDFLVARVGQEVDRARGEAPPFAPDWEPPQRFAGSGARLLPVWAFYALLVLAAALVYLGLRALLRSAG